MAEPTEKTQPAKRKMVLVVDDDPVYRKVLSLGLDSAGYDVLAAENGKEAMRVLSDHKPDIVLLDMLMPVMDGLQFLRWMKEKAQPQIPTLVLTCLDRRSVFVEALVEGATDVITKPFDLTALLRRLSTLA